MERVHNIRIRGLTFRSDHLLAIISVTEQEAFLRGCAFICKMRKVLEAAGASGELDTGSITHWESNPTQQLLL